jgi:AAHS family 4-hydroxybenzoate transporter-like MFS transporter
MNTVDVGRALDEGRWTNYQILLIVGTALTIILDGVDNQLLPNAVPALMNEWGLERAAFANALAAGPFGMMVGGIVGGLLGDRIGRRTSLLTSAIAFGIITLVIAYVTDLKSLMYLRLVAGIGLGGAMPNAAALVSEYVPRRIRPIAVTSTIVCIPLGGFIAGQLAAAVIGPYGWRRLFIVGGIIPLVMAAVLFVLLPESPRFLAVHRERWNELRHLLRRMGHSVADDDVFVDATASVSAAAPGQAKGTFFDLFRPAYLPDTLGLFGAFFFCLMANYIGFQLIPAVLSGKGGLGFTQPQGSQALSLFNFGGVGGAIVGALVIQRFGSRVTMLGMSALAVVSALVMTAYPPRPDAVPFAMTMFTITGGLLNAVQTTMFALAAHVYPIEIRGRGVGTSMAVGRVGNVLAVYAGNMAIRLGGAPAYCASWAVTMALVLVSLAVVRRHIPRSTVEPAFAVSAEH